MVKIVKNVIFTALERKKAFSLSLYSARKITFLTFFTTV
jgi:hypothetical protein